jgi:hypothetical protein
MKQVKSGKSPDPVQDASDLLVDRLYNDIIQESCVIFIGAGSTTERSVHGRGFYSSIKSQAGFPQNEPAPSFPKLMQYFCEKLDGGQHNRLIREAISYLERFSLPGEHNRFATMVSSQLAGIPYLNRFVTTNWDPFIERELDILVPIVEDRDLAFWDDKKRQVLKIHGCITRPYSIVATQGDYDACTTQNPLIFNKLKDLMATKTFLFIGYSMRDEDFREVWGTITGSLGRFAKLGYALDHRSTAENAKFWHDRGIELINTSDVMFLRSLRSRLENDGLVPSKKFMRFLHLQRERIASIHMKLDQTSNGGIASAMYQDGLLHELEDALSSVVLGTRRMEDHENELRRTAKIVKQAWAADDFIEIAYWTGRLTVLEHFCSRDDTPISPFFHPKKMVPIPRIVKG